MDFLNAGERARLDALRRGDLAVDETLLQVERITTSRPFERVQQRARDFLGFVVAKTLLGEADQIKESTIAIGVFHESADFNPLETSKVRTAAGDLRERLATYYAAEGRYDPVHILIPLSTYAPEIRDRRVAVAVVRLANWHPRQAQDYLCTTIRDEIAHLLDQAECVHASAWDDVDTTASEPRFLVRGSLESMTDLLKVNISLSDRLAGRIVCSQSLEERRDDLLKLCRDVAEFLLRALTTPTEPKDAVRVMTRKRSAR